MSYLPAGGVPSEVAECVGEPVVDVVEGELLVGRLHDGRTDEGSIRVGRPYILHPVEFSVLSKVLLWVEVRVATVMVGHLTKLGSKQGEPKLGMSGEKTHPAAVTLSGKTSWVGRLLVQGASDIACTDHVRASRPSHI